MGASVPLIDKLRAIHDEPADRDLLEFFGVDPDQFHWARDRVTVGGETVTMAEARAAVLGGPIASSGSSPRRTVAIGDL
jgi:hypothetical protein